MKTWLPVLHAARSLSSPVDFDNGKRAGDPSTASAIFFADAVFKLPWNYRGWRWPRRPTSRAESSAPGVE